MTTYTEVFGGGTIYPAEPTFLSLVFAVDVVLVWPIEQSVGGDDIVAKIMNLHPAGAGLSVTLSDARLVSTGYTTSFNNKEADTVTILDSTGGTILTVASGEVWTIYLNDNSTAAGTWDIFEQGAGTSTANAAALAGAGLKAITTTLNTKLLPVAHTTNYAILDADRATVQEWTGALGNFALPNPATVGADWYVVVKNAGTGSVTVTPAAGTIDGSASLIYGVDESSFIYSDGSNFFTVGFGQAVNSVFDFIVINVSGTGDYTLSGAELNRISYEFIGVLAGNRNIIVPAAVQQYWVDNETTGAFSLTVKTLSGTGVTVPQGQRTILYCNGTDVIHAETFIVSTPVGVTQGGTGLVTVAQGDLLYGSATNTYSLLAKNTSATRYLSNTGTTNNPAWAQVDVATGVTGILPAANGGTGNAFTLFSGPATTVKTFTLPNASATILTSATVVTVPQGGTGLATVAQGDLLYGSAADTYSRLTKDGSATRYLSNTGSSNNPAWAQVNLANGVTGNLPVANLNSGTGATSASFWRGDGTWASPTPVTPTTVTITGNQQNIVVYPLVGSPGGAVTVTFTVEAGVLVTSLGTGNPAIDFKGFASGSTINFVNAGHVLGHGGRGGTGGTLSRVGDDDYGFGGNPGTAGGNAIEGPGTGITFNITNASGFIWGGGGGGGGGGASADDGSNTANGGGGGGGAGWGLGGMVNSVSFHESITTALASPGTDGFYNISGAAANGTGGAATQTGSASGGAGGNGGDFGAAGSAGASPTTFTVDVAGGAAGAAGKAINLNGGSASFISGSGSPNVKGAVS